MISVIPAPLEVDSDKHATEIERFFRNVLKGPNLDDCWLWMAPPRDDGYGQFSITRNELERIVRAHRYVLALALAEPLPSNVHGLHRCNVTICVHATLATTTHLGPGSHADNMAQMGRQHRGGGNPLYWKFRGTDRAALAARARAIQAACAHGWDADAIADAKSRHPVAEQGLLF